MTIRATIDIASLNANVPFKRTAVAPPFGRTEKTDNGRAGGDCKMRRTRVAADVNFSAPRQLIKAFERQIGGKRLFRFCRRDNSFSQAFFAGTERDD